MLVEARAWAELHASALIHNLRKVKTQTDAAVIAVIKANAYGHGLSFAAKALEPEANAYAVATLQEAIDLRALCPDMPIILLSGFYHPAQIPLFVREHIRPVIFNLQQLDWLESAAAIPRSVWLKIDTGMGRLGIEPAQLEPALQRLDALSVEVGLMSHFASADTPQAMQNEQQHDCFEVNTETRGLPRSFANSAAIMSRPQDHYEWVRPGIMLYGSSPFADKSASELGLLPVMALYARLIEIKSRKKGQTVGYGAHWTAQTDCEIGIVSIGYGDGYPRVVSNAQVAIDGKRYPLVGRVSMDSFAILLNPGHGLQGGATVELWGNTISVDEVAEWAGTIGYELLCKVTSRVERRQV